MTDAGPRFCALPGAHWLHAQKTSHWPRLWVFFDTEAHRADDGALERQSWRLGVSATVNWRDAKRVWSEPKLARHETPGELWARVDGFARPNARTVVVAHNLGYDLRISRGLEVLPALGWSIERPTFGGDHVGLEATKAGARLVLTDSHSLFPHSLATIAGWLGEVKPGLPDEDATEETWWERCEADVKVLARAYMAVVDWLSSNDLGGWGRTGPAIGWHTLLRHHLHTPVLVHGRPEVRETEAAAMYAGRCEVWRHGPLRGGPWYEWDYEAAHAHVCAEEALPAVLAGEVLRPRLAAMGDGGKGSAYLVQADISTDVPVLAYADELGICWPVGNWRGWYWDHELLLAVEEGAKVTPRHAYRYRASPWLSDWAAWCLETMAGRETPEERVRAGAAKHWTRTVPGRSAMRYRPFELAGPAWRPGVNYWPLLDADNGARGAALQLGEQRFEAWRLEWWDQALPQLLSAVMAHCRIRLWEAMATAGFDHVVYVDTDSLIVDRAGNANLTRAVAEKALWSLRYKDSHATFNAGAPQLVTGSSYRRLAGVPKGATLNADGKWEGQAWEAVTTSMAAGHPGEVHVRRVQMALAGVDTRRLHLDGNRTAPFTVTNGARQAPTEEATA